jgi:hypothetical protein
MAMREGVTRPVRWYAEEGEEREAEDKEWKADCSPVVLAPLSQKASSDTEATDSKPTA